MEELEFKENRSYFIPDVDGVLFEKYRDCALEAGLEIKHMDLIDPSKSCAYNPVTYVSGYDEAEMLARCIVGDSKTKALLASLIAVTAVYVPEEKRNLEFVAGLLSEPESGFMEELISAVESVDANDPLVAAFYTVKKNAGKRFPKVCGICLKRLRFLLDSPAGELFKEDEAELDALIMRPIAFFVTIPGNDDSLHFVAEAAYRQAYVAAYKYCLDSRTMPISISFFSEEFKALLPGLDM